MDYKINKADKHLLRTLRNFRKVPHELFKTPDRFTKQIGIDVFAITQSFLVKQAQYMPRSERQNK